MPKALCIIGTVIAALMFLIFGLDLALGFPFSRVSLVMDIGFVVCSAALGFASWATLREQR
jgi:hypothetical protein